MGVVSILLKLKMAIKTYIQFPSRFLWLTDLVWTLTMVIKQTNINNLIILQMIKKVK